jgi:hypothetical protein
MALIGSSLSKSVIYCLLLIRYLNSHIQACDVPTFDLFKSTDMIYNTTNNKASGDIDKPYLKKARQESRHQIRRLLRSFESLKSSENHLSQRIKHARKPTVNYSKIRSYKGSRKAAL